MRLFYYLLFSCVGSEKCSSRYREILPNSWPVIFVLTYNKPAASALYLYRPCKLFKTVKGAYDNAI